jgi:hypothetical protein
VHLQRRCSGHVRTGCQARKLLLIEGVVSRCCGTLVCWTASGLDIMIMMSPVLASTSWIALATGRACLPDTAATYRGAEAAPPGPRSLWIGRWPGPSAPQGGAPG